MKLVIIETPYSGDIQVNVEYAKRCLKDSLDRGEAPFASHLLYTQVLNDAAMDQRHLGMESGFAWGKHADLVAVYTDLGTSKGMQVGIDRALRRNIPIEYRKIDGKINT